MSDDYFFMCDCGGELIGLAYLMDFPESPICLSMWSRGQNTRSDWRYRLSAIWQIIRKGHPYEDEILLNKADARKLGEKLIEMAEEK